MEARAWVPVRCYRRVNDAIASQPRRAAGTVEASAEDFVVRLKPVDKLTDVLA
jgi:hypothetical protein